MKNFDRVLVSVNRVVGSNSVGGDLFDYNSAYLAGDIVSLILSLSRHGVDEAIVSVETTHPLYAMLDAYFTTPYEVAVSPRFFGWIKRQKKLYPKYLQFNVTLMEKGERVTRIFTVRQGIRTSSLTRILTKHPIFYITEYAPHQHELLT